MKYEYFFNDDETLDDADNLPHEGSSHVSNGKTIARNRKYRTFGGDDIESEPLDKNVMIEKASSSAQLQGEASELDRDVADGVARKQRKKALKAAQKSFKQKAENDNKLKAASGVAKKTKSKEPAVRITESWHIRDQITKGTFGNDDETKYRFLTTLRRLAGDLSTAGADTLGLSVHTTGKEPLPDYAVQRDQHGRVVFDNGITIARKTRKKDATRQEDGQPEARYDGSSIIVKDPSLIGCSFHGDQFPFAAADASNRLEEIEVGLGPLWAILRNAIVDNWKLAEVGQAFGKTAPQDSAVGNVLIDVALKAAADVYDRIDAREQSEATFLEWLQDQPGTIPIPARKVKQLFRQKHAGVSFKQNRSDKSIISAANDNDRAWLAA